MKKQTVVAMVGAMVVLNLIHSFIYAQDLASGQDVKVGLRQVPKKVKTAILEAVGNGKLVDIGCVYGSERVKTLRNRNGY